jgi:hypothetical protein
MSGFETFLDEGMRDLLGESDYLVEREVARINEGNKPLHDYGFVVFPAAKAYEGFLKKLFWELKFINRAQYFGDKFRIGRALNPNLPVRYRWDWVYEKLIAYCGTQRLVQDMWEVWKMARNEVFHFFPGHARFISLSEAEALVAKIKDTMEKSLSGCKVQVGIGKI